MNRVMLKIKRHGRLNSQRTIRNSPVLSPQTKRRQLEISTPFIRSLAFATALSLIPWPSIFNEVRGHPYVDRQAYIAQIEGQYLRFDYAEYSNIIDYITDEFAWGAILNFLVRDLNLGIQVTFSILSFFICFSFIFFITHTSSFKYTLLLVNPLFVDLAVSQMRSGLAISFLLWAYVLGTKKSKLKLLQGILVLLGCTTHTVGAFFLVVFACGILIARQAQKWTSVSSYTISAFIGIAFGLIMGPLRGPILALLGDRRYSVDYGSASFLFLSLWMILLILLTMDWRGRDVNPLRVLALIFLIQIILGAFFGNYTTRFLALALPILLSTFSTLRSDLRMIAVLAYLGYLTIQWSIWFGAFAYV